MAAGALISAWASPAAAHPLDELVQQVYITPQANRVRIDVELAVGVEVAEDYADLIDQDDDGSISESEWNGLQSVVLSTITIELDGETVPANVDDAARPDSAVLRSGEGVIAFSLSVPATDAQTQAGITVIDDYAPEHDGTPFPTRVQMNVTPLVDWTVDVGRIERSPDGRRLSTTFVPSGNDVARPVGTSATGSSGSPGVLGWAVGLAVLAALVVIGWRLNRRR